MNGLLWNWYDGPDEYIGPHNDASDALFVGSPIVTVTFGEEHTFRLRPNKGTGYVDIPFPSGAFLVIPFHTNRCWKHEVPKNKKCRGR